LKENAGKSTEIPVSSSEVPATHLQNFSQYDLATITSIHHQQLHNFAKAAKYCKWVSLER
jgi:hypothetical protein